MQENGEVCPTLTATETGVCRIERIENRKGNTVCVDDTYGYEEDERIYAEAYPSLRSGRTGLKVADDYRIRKLTPLECWRLMDFSDEDFRKAERVNSNTQLYKQAGNSIVRGVLAAIMSQLNIRSAGSRNEAEEA